MNLCVPIQTVEANCQKFRNRSAELYLNGACLLSVVFHGDWRKTPFFLSNLWRALAE
jgi:hypothetical protein